MKRRVIFLALLALAGAGAYLLYRSVSGSARETVFYGNVDIRDVSLGFRVSGRVQKMLVDEGDQVEEGQLLAVLDKEPFQNDLSLRVASLQQQEATLQRFEAGSRSQEIEQARANVAARKATLENARGVYRRQQELARQDFASKQAYENALAQFNDAEAQLKAAQEALDLAIEGSRKEDIAGAKAAVAAAKAQRDISDTSLRDTDLKAPADGVVLTRAVEPGAIVAAGTTVYTVSLKRPVWVRAYVPEPKLGLLAPGMNVKIFTDTRPDRPYEGQIGYISPVAEFTPKTVETPELRADLVYRFRVTVRNSDDSLRQGMPVTVKLAPGQARTGTPVAELKP